MHIYDTVIRVGHVKYHGCIYRLNGGGCMFGNPIAMIEQLVVDACMYIHVTSTHQHSLVFVY